MKAAQITTYGNPSVITINEVETPQPSADQVLIKVHAASLNPFDTMVREGYLQHSVPLTLPATIGGDIAGIVVAVGSNVSSLQVGDKVYGDANIVAGASGAFAEFATTSVSKVAIAPNNTSFEEAAALPLIGVSALEALMRNLDLQPGQRLFIHGAGGIGAIALQIAKYIGAYTAITATGKDINYVKSLGADEIIDYKQVTFHEVLKNFDAVFDTVGGEDFSKSFAILAPGGKAVSMIAPVDESLAKKYQITAIAQQTRTTTVLLDQLRQLVEDDVIKPRIGQVFSLDDIVKAFKAREAGGTHGKIVLTVSS